MHEPTPPTLNEHGDETHPAHPGTDNPRRTWYGRNGGSGFGGALFRFRLLATGEVIESNNVWYQGRIPDEYRDVMPDNAIREPTDA